jgi:hypothetical protein
MKIHQATLNVSCEKLHCNYATDLTMYKSSGSSSYYNFSNIRYGQLPLGSLQFSAPLPPQGRNTTVNTGQQAVICPQSDPGQSILSPLLHPEPTLPRMDHSRPLVPRSLHRPKYLQLYQPKSLSIPHDKRVVSTIARPSNFRRPSLRRRDGTHKDFQLNAITEKRNSTDRQM